MVDFAKQREQPLQPPSVPHLVVGVTGHRPHKLDSRGRPPTHRDLDGYEWSNPLRQRLRQEMAATLQALVAAYSSNDNIMRALHVDSYLRQVAWRPGFDYHTTPYLAVSGVALGVDQDFCGVCARLEPELPYVAAVPFPGQESRWPASSQRVYAVVLERAAGVVYVSKEKPQTHDSAARMLSARNDWVQYVSDEVVAVHDGSSGGTGNMVRSCRRAGLQPHVIDPRDCRLN